MGIGERIKARREQLNMSQDELAQKMGYKSRSTIAKIESEINEVTQSKIVAFAKALNTSTGYLMGDDAPTKRSYYLDPETAALAQELHDNPQYRALLDSSKKLSPEALKEVMHFIDFQTKKESGSDD